MGANILFDEMLPAPAQEAPGLADPQRQLEVFQHGGKMWLRIGPLNEQNSGANRYTVELSDETREILLVSLSVTNRP